tara:strand:- start:640 stop:1332 length:693 start_codon:yes stop_codon:yes gene_type:complete
MAPIVPIIVIVGSILIRTTAKQLPKVLRRFKGAKEVTNPSSRQIDKAERLTHNYTNFNKSDAAKLKKVDTKHPSYSEIFLGKGRTPGQKKMEKPASTSGEATRRTVLDKFKGATGATAVVGGLGGAATLYTSSKGRKKTRDLRKKLSRAELERDIERAVSKVERERKKSKPSAGAKDKGKTALLSSVSVKKGDTLIALSKRHGVSLEKLKELNPKVKPREMKIGSRIKLK